MAISRILHMNSHHKSNGSHLQVAIDYILKDEKTMNGLLTGSVNCIKENAYECMEETKRIFGKTDKRQGYHLIISFEENECDGNTAMKVIEDFVREYLESDYEAVYAVHTNTDHVNGHIIWNSVRFTDGYKYHYKKGDWEKDIQPRIDRICEKYNLSTLEKSIEKTDKKEWDVLKNGPFVWNEQIKKDIDACVLRAVDYSMFLQMLESEGYEIKQGKYLALRPPGMERFRRTKTLGQGYGMEELKERIIKENIHTYRRNQIVRAPRIKVFKAKKIRRMRMTGLQRQYFKEMYRLGKIRKQPYSQVWKYKKDVKKFKLLQKQYLFLAKYDVTDVEQISDVQKDLRKKVSVLLKAKKVIVNEMDKNLKVFQAVENIDKEKKATIFYKMGDDIFKESEQIVFESKKTLEQAGLSFDDAKKLRGYYTELLQANERETKQLRKEINVGYKILNEARERKEVKELEARTISEDKKKQEEQEKKYVKRK